MNIGLFALEADAKKEAIKYIIDSSSPRKVFFFNLILSVVIVTFGLLMNNAPIVIGGMLVSPLLSPFISAALGIVIADHKLIRRSLFVIFKSSLIAVFIALLISLFVINKKIDTEIISRINPDLNYFFVAIASGIAAAYSIAKKEGSERLIGVAITIAVLPPLSVVGIGISQLDWQMVSGAVTLFLLNLFGITLAAVSIFSLFRFYPEKNTVVKELKKEEKILEKEKNIDE